MKIIKFRVWNPDSKKMIYIPNVSGSYLHFGTNDFLSNMNWFVSDGKSSCAYSDRSILMQFTGLLDQDSKEIYFEDYVKDENFSAYTFIVKWNKTKISLLNISNGDIIDIDSINNLIINSNVYENSFEFTTKYREIS